MLRLVVISALVVTFSVVTGTPRPLVATAATLGYADSGTLTSEQQLEQWKTLVFERAWKADGCVQQKQSWSDYWYWVREFYLDSTYGWFAKSDTLVGKINDAQARKDLRPQLEDLGKRVASEWSKDNSCRKIDTAVLWQWREQLSVAAAKDSGNGVEIIKAVQGIARQVDARLSPTH